MNCFTHRHVSAVAMCFGCGKAICGDCLHEASTNRYVCSPDCSSRVKTMDLAFQLVAKKTLRAYSLLALFMVLPAVPMALLGLAKLFLADPDIPLALFDLSSSGVFFLAGYWFYRMGKKDTQ